MKNILFFLIWSSGMSITAAQFSDLQIVSSAGSSYQANDHTLDWTIGEVVISSMENSSMLLSQGFHQSNFTLVAVKPIPEDLGSVVVFPNPFSEEIEIKIKYTHPQIGVLQLFDFTGKEIWRKPFEGKDINEKFSTTSYPAGTYLFTFSIADQPFVSTYQLVKIH